MAFRKKIRKKKTNNFLKNFNYPVIILTVISLLLICSLVYNFLYFDKSIIDELSSKPNLSKLLKKNSYEKKYNHRIQMQVNNGCGQRGYAETYKIFLREEGFDVMQINNEKKYYPFTTINYHTNKKEMADYLAEILGGDGYRDSIQIFAVPNENLGFDLTLIIGEDITGIAAFK